MYLSIHRICLFVSTFVGPLEPPEDRPVVDNGQPGAIRVAFFLSGGVADAPGERPVPAEGEEVAGRRAVAVEGRRGGGRDGEKDCQDDQGVLLHR